MSGLSAKPAALESFEIDLNFKGGAVAIFQRNHSEHPELIIQADKLRDVAAGYQAHRPNDAAMVRRAAAAYEMTLAKT